MKNILIPVVIVLLIIYMIYKGRPSYYRIKGRNFYTTGDYESAKRAFEKALQSGMSNPEIYMEYSHILMMMGEFDDAERALNNLLCNKVENSLRGRAVIQRCLCYFNNNNFDEAYKDASELYDDGYRSIDLYGFLGMLKLINDPKSDETFDFCVEAYEYDDENRDICDNMVLAYYNKGEYDRAKELSDELTEEYPQFVEGWYHAAQIDIALNDYESALEKLDKIGECKRSAMTTVSDDEINNLKDEIERLSEVKD